MPSRGPPTEGPLAQLYEHVELLSSDYDQDAIYAHRLVCEDNNQVLYGPFLQFKTLDINIGRWYMIRRERDSGLSTASDGKPVYITRSLSREDRRNIAEFVTENKIKLPAKRARASQTAAPKRTRTAAPKAKRAKAVKKREIAAPARARSRSPSVEFVRIVPAPALYPALVVHVFYEDKQAPMTLTLNAQKGARFIAMDAHEGPLLSAEVKQSERVKILTVGAPELESWSPFVVSQLQIPRTVPSIVIARSCVRVFHDDLQRLYPYARPDADKWPGRVRTQCAESINVDEQPSFFT
ncbi:unnamed protein product [Peniophora sp. CBMAI 1063]|nr:unnamed protein product [Peniophora sp. CBMAI 1063]